MEYNHGGDIYTNQGMLDFSANINPLGPSRRVVSAAAKAVRLMAQYPDSRCRGLRGALVAVQGIRPEHLIFGNGAAELIYLLTAADRPGKALLIIPSFSEYRQALAAANCEIIKYPLAEENGFQLDKRILNFLNPDIDMIFLCSPSNPVGNIIDHGLLLQILKQCQKNGIRMVLDECFYEFLDKWQEHTLQQELERHTMLFILRAFTKMHAMPGLRLGYGMCKDQELLERMERLRQPWSISVVAQAAGAAAAFDTGHAERTRDFIRQEREWLLNQLSELGINYFMPAANFIFFKSGQEIYEKLKTCGILIRDCSNYDGLGQGYYRIAIRTRTDNLKLLAALRGLCHSR